MVSSKGMAKSRVNATGCNCSKKAFNKRVTMAWRTSAISDFGALLEIDGRNRNATRIMSWIAEIGFHVIQEGTEFQSIVEGRVFDKRTERKPK
jgi:hypothetical protein